MANLVEKWSEVDGYDGKYLISNFGRLKSLKRSSEIMLKHNINRLGYCVFTLCYNGKLKTHTVHRLVALNFIPNPDNKQCVNHIDGNKENNNNWNLEWNTISENNRHAVKTGLNIATKGVEHYNSRFTEKDVLDIRKSILSESKLALMYSVNRATIGKIKRKERYKNL